ncbi:16957_t:CDS:2, partial [Gigaspora rosea]
AIIEFKCLLVHMIQTKLKTSVREAGRQLVTIPCLESQFIGVFNGYMNRYSPLWMWGVREYENNQQTWVILNGSENEKTKYLEIRWERKEIIDAANHISALGAFYLRLVGEPLLNDYRKLRKRTIAVPRIFLIKTTCAAPCEKLQIFGNMERDTYTLYYTLGVQKLLLKKSLALRYHPDKNPNATDQ